MIMVEVSRKITRRLENGMKKRQHKTTLKPNML